MIDTFIAEHCTPDPAAKTPIRKLFDRFKTMPGSESWKKARFVNELIRSHVDVRKESGAYYVRGYRVADETPSTPARPQVRRREREDKVRLCSKCGGPIHPCYDTYPFLCEDCFAFDQVLFSYKKIQNVHTAANTSRI